MLMRVIGLFVALFLFSTVVVTQAVSLSSEVRGLIIPKLRTTISAEIEASVTAISVAMGQRFKSGRTIVSLADEVYRAQLERARCELLSARRLLTANKKLYQLKSISELEMAQSQTRVDLAENDMLLYQLQLKRCTVSAPFTGRVIEVLVSQHQFVTTGTPLLEIIDDRHLLIQAFISSSLIGSISVGQTFELHVDEVGHSYQAKITSLGAVVDPNSRMLELRGVFAKHHAELLAGMSGNILFDTNNKQDVVHE